MAKIAIQYCVECMFLGRALEIAKMLLDEHPHEIEYLQLVPGTEGVFTIELDQEPIFHIGEEGRLPSPDEIRALVEPKLLKPV
jgi:selenoprotein W-related protein